MRKKLASIVLLGLLCGADVPKSEGAAKEKAVRDELVRLQGSWQMISAIRDGAVVPESTLKKTKAEIKGSAISVTYGSWTLIRDEKFEIDPSVDPKWMTETISSGWDKGKENRGIYRLEGDRLTICIAATGKPRPSEFASRPGSGMSVRTFRKVAAKAP